MKFNVFPMPYLRICNFKGVLAPGRLLIPVSKLARRCHARVILNERICEVTPIINCGIDRRTALRGAATARVREI